jgi:hypothetical protein
MNTVAGLNVELKGTKSLQEKSANALREISQKYEELRADYLDLMMMTGLSREEAERHLNDKELLLFSKQVAHHEAEIKLKQKVQRKARVINSQIDVDLLLEEIEAEDEF